MNIKSILFLFYFYIPFTAQSQTLAVFEVSAGKTNRLNSVVSINIEGITSLSENELQLSEIKKGAKTAIPFQIEQNGSGRKLWWILSGETMAGAKRNFVLAKSLSKIDSQKAIAAWANNALLISVNQKPVLQYNYKTKHPPVGVDSIFQKSGFLHPVWAPSGAVLTNIQPPDHYHHYGIWNAWTKTTFESDTIDFWNLGDKKGTVRFNGFGNVYNGQVFAGFRVLHEHVVLTKHPEKIALNEEQDIRVYNFADRYMWDFTSSISCASASPITFEQYRYGGFVFRATEEWTNQNSEILTSEGKTRKDANATFARWCMATGQTGAASAGILILAYPTNYNFPEPLRVWPEDANNNRGDVFINFTPTQNKPWKIVPGNNYVLRYRIITFGGELTNIQAEQAWNDFAYPPIVTVMKIH